MSGLLLGTMFSGGGLTNVGAKSLGIESAWGIECSGEIAEVYAANLPGRIIRKRVQDVHPRELDKVDILWASPVCKEASAANAGGEEGEEERSQADAICRVLRALRPPAFILENVPPYRHFESFHRITETLCDLGYRFDAQNLNAADYGVPQTRRRLILRALRNSDVPPMRQTHIGPTREGGGLIDCLLPWNGWYAAIEDLIPTLPESKFANWQIKRLPRMMSDLLVHGTSTMELRDGDEPAAAVMATVHTKAAMPRGFIVHATDQRTMPVRDSDDPMFTVMAGSFDKSHFPAAYPRAFIVDTSNSGNTDTNPTGRGLAIRDADEPAVTVRAGANHIQRAFLVGGSNTSDEQAAAGVGVSESGEPTRCVVPRSVNWRAFLVDGQNANHMTGIPTIRDGEARSFSVSNQHKGISRALLSENGCNDHNEGLEWLEHGRVVAMTPRALGRFQSLPDWYILPSGKGANRIACTVIGNGVPCDLAAAVIGSLLSKNGEIGGVPCDVRSTETLDPA